MQNQNSDSNELVEDEDNESTRNNNSGILDETGMNFLSLKVRYNLNAKKSHQLFKEAKSTTLQIKKDDDYEENKLQHWSNDSTPKNQRHRE